MEASQNENAAKFLTHVSSDFAGDKTNLDMALRKDFSFFDNIYMRYTLNNVASNAQGIFVSLNYNRSVISSRSGRTFTDRGMTVFQKVTQEMDAWLSDHNVCLEDIIGAAHRE